jgi:cytochrome P450
MAHVAVSLIGLDVEDDTLDQLLDYADVIAMAVDVKWASGDHQEVIRQGHVSVDAFTASMYEPGVVRREHPDSTQTTPTHPDLIGQMLMQHDWDSALRLRECLVYLSAGIRTTAHAVTRTFEALENWYDKDPTRRRSLDGTFFRLACNEALRLNPPSPALVRESRADYTYQSGRQVAKAERVAVDLLAANTDVSVFGDNAAEFDPLRTLPPRVPGYGLSFGAGQHTCIGKPLVTASGVAGGEGQLNRAVALLLLALYEHGLRRDPERAPVYAASAQDRYDSFPTLLQMGSVRV